MSTPPAFRLPLWGLWAAVALLSSSHCAFAQNGGTSVDSRDSGFGNLSIITNLDGLAAAEQPYDSALGTHNNVALIRQQTSSALAYINQTGSQNFASVAQTGRSGDLAAISQSGNNHRAAMYQH